MCSNLVMNLCVKKYCKLRFVHVKSNQCFNIFDELYCVSSGFFQVIAESLSEEEIAGLREMFKAMDTDNSGAITFDELKAGLRKYGSTLKDTEIRELMDAVRKSLLQSD